MHNCHSSGRCKQCEQEGGLQFEVSLFTPLCPHACAPVWEHGAAMSGNVDLSNMGMDCYNHWVIAPTLSTPPPALCIKMTVCLPSVLLIQTFSLSSPSTSLLGVTVCLCVSVETWLFPFWRGIFCCIFVLFLFCKAYDSYCIRASSNNKNSKKLIFFSIFTRLFCGCCCCLFFYEGLMSKDFM